jgi:cytochrome c
LRFATTLRGMMAVVAALPMPVAGLMAASLAPDAAHGKRLFERCAECHAIAAGAEAMTAPSLHGLMGRRAGSREDYDDYSPAMKAAGEAGLVWNEDRLLAYLADPQAVVPGGFMPRPSLRGDRDRADVVAYLAGLGR